MGDVREAFLLRPDVVFLNHGSFGACPESVFEDYQRWQRELEGQPVEFLGRRLPDLMASSRAALADFIGAHPDEVVYVPNATTALNVVARSLRLGPGDEVLATDHEYGAVDRMWRFVCERRGARYVRAEVPVPVTSHEAVVDAVWSRVTDRTRVLFCSHITSPTALIFPVAELVRRARAAGILTVIDGAHAPGQVRLDLRRLGADFYAGNCHKWMCAPKGAGFLWARREVHDLLEPLVVSWGWDPERPTAAGADREEAKGGGLLLGGARSRLVAHHEWQGTRDPAAYLSVPAAIAFLRDRIGPQARARCHDLASLARERIGRITGLPPLSPDGPDFYAQMVSLLLPLADPEPAQDRLHRLGIEVPIVRWNGRCLLRVSVQVYNDAHDIERLVAALPDIL
ncbi:MAG: aminotransferase class V-fold PLP-dependent enzyme [Armatimonadota bacterium]|nr:aminotransferase class V-fold PLP-dependent enzyme [Armatimonadota bacterium]MDR5696335.1 aminotransferase class V-fold PLP-dependent enzyme [Armatimonadota bacterium]